jgi:cysteine desulfurase
VPNLNPIYFDHVSSTPVHPEVLKSQNELYPIHYANSEALHDAGHRIANMVDKSRESIASLLKIKVENITFTSGATESNNAIIKGIAFANASKGKHLITSSVEHSSVLESFKQLETSFGFEVTYLSVDKEGRISLQELKDALRADTTLVSIMHVNNEIGTIMPVKACAEIIKANSSAVFHVDEVQAIGKIPFDFSFVDAASCSAHKINGVKGSGLMIVKEKVRILSLITGGQQEYGRRGGTANAINNILFAKTLRLALSEYETHLKQVQILNQFLRNELKEIKEVVINSPEREVSSYIINFSVLTLSSEVLLNWFNSQNIYVSAQSTCNSKMKHVSITLQAMGLNETILNGSIRLGISASNTLEEAQRFISVLKEGLETYGSPLR